MRDVASECVARLRDGGDFDVVADLAIPLPITIIAEMLGVEPERRADFKHWSDVLVASVSGSGRERDPRENGLAASLQAVCEYAMEVAARRRREPGDDLISVLLSAQEGDVALTDVELALFVQLLLVAGNETTTNLIGNATNALLRHREQLARVRADRSLVPALVEETLRWDGPIQFLFRRATREVDLPSGRIPANAHVVALIGSANRDERQWGRTAERFDVGRDTTGHLAFGLGNHFCLGASLARLEARVALEALVGELARFEAREARVEYVDSFLVRGPKTLPLRLAA
jgi:cytochrome P450